EGSADAAHIAVVEGGVLEGNLGFSGLSHWPTLADWVYFVKFLDVLLFPPGIFPKVTNSSATFLLPLVTTPTFFFT
nr:hypothetical protein [Cellvibrionaceae bacterium]